MIFQYKWPTVHNAAQRSYVSRDNRCCRSIQPPQTFLIKLKLNVVITLGEPGDPVQWGAEISTTRLLQELLCHIQRTTQVGGDWCLLVNFQTRWINMYCKIILFCEFKISWFDNIGHDCLWKLKFVDFKLCYIQCAAQVGGDCYSLLVNFQTRWINIYCKIILFCEHIISWFDNIGHECGNLNLWISNYMLYSVCKLVFKLEARVE